MRQWFYVTGQAADAIDGSQKARVVFFGGQAEELLGLKATLVSPETIFDLKREFLEGKTLKLKALAKRRQDGGIELIAKQLRGW